MKRRLITGLLIGICAGILDVIPMVIQDLAWDANLSAFFLWVVVGLLLGMTGLKINGIFNGIILAFLVLLPNLFIIGCKEPLSLIPILVMTVILGGVSGFVHMKLNPAEKNG